MIFLEFCIKKSIHHLVSTSDDDIMCNVNTILIITFNTTVSLVYFDTPDFYWYCCQYILLKPLWQPQAAFSLDNVNYKQLHNKRIVFGHWSNKAEKQLSHFHMLTVTVISAQCFIICVMFFILSQHCWQLQQYNQYSPQLPEDVMSYCRPLARLKWYKWRKCEYNPMI